MKQLTIYRRQKEDKNNMLLKNGSYYLDDLKAFYKIVYSKSSGKEVLNNIINNLEKVKEDIKKELTNISLQDLDLGQEFEIGDEVWSNADEKKKEMLIKIVDKKIHKLSKRVIYKCEYKDKDYLKKLGWKKKYFYNAGRFLRGQKFPYGLTTIFENELKARLNSIEYAISILGVNNE